jgi:hypothetical protein
MQLLIKAVLYRALSHRSEYSSQHQEMNTANKNSNYVHLNAYKGICKDAMSVPETGVTL